MGDERQDRSGGITTPAADTRYEIWRTGPVWLHSDRRLAKYVGRPLAGFLKVEAAGGILLLAAAIIALIWANSAWSDAYEDLWTTQITLRIADFELSEDLRHWVNDGVMALFFFVVGLEIKYEMVSGELREPKSMVLPIMAAFGGMAAPALIYLAFNSGSEASHGWGVPMATDIAFALGVLAVLGARIPAQARVFLLTLAIVDDIGAIAVIAVFYTDDLSVVWLWPSLLILAAVVALRVVRVWSMPVYVLMGIGLWFTVFESGVHATIAGVVMGLLAPAKPLLDQVQARAYAQQCAPDNLTARELRHYRFLLRESVPVAERLEHSLHPWSSYVVLPVFALANAGIDLRGGVLSDAVTSPITIGVALGLIVGKTVGITAMSWLAVRLKWGRLPPDTSWGMLTGLAMVAGVGFTVSLFITGLAFGGDSLHEADAKVGVLGGSVVAAGAGAALLLAATRRREKAS